MKKVKVLLIGIGGYGENYLKQFLFEGMEQAKLVAIVDPCARKSSLFEQILETGIPYYCNTTAFYETGAQVDLVVIASPIHTHYQYIMEALRYGCDVLCEKPVVFDLVQLDALIEMERTSGHFVAVGFQQCYLDTVLSLKKDILNGMYGNPVQMKSLRMMRRGDRYYNRNNWAGKRVCNDQYIYDSPLSNACAHQIQTMLFLLGSNIRTSVGVKAVDGCRYQGRPSIENYDAIAIRVHTTVGVSVLYYTSHCIEESKVGPIGELLFDKAQILFEGDSFTAFFTDGSKRMYSNGENGSPLQKLFVAISCCLHGDTPPCTLETVRSHSEVVLLSDSLKTIDHPDAIYREIEGDGTYIIPNLSKVFFEAYSTSTLPRNCNQQAEA
nr:Gfo/Idh/MocA family oxidoreductase [uncultured Sphaerochaeta sp.]